MLSLRAPDVLRRGRACIHGRNNAASEQDAIEATARAGIGALVDGVRETLHVRCLHR